MKASASKAPLHGADSAGKHMSLLVVGSVAYDSVATPAGSRQDALGGSATYFSIASSYFTPVGVVAVVGDDFDARSLAFFEKHGVDTSGLERRRGTTFRWAGVYSADDGNTRRTLDTQLNVFADFSPSLTAAQRQTPYVFLANIDPDLQMAVLGQVEPRPKLVALDTMDFWIEGKNSSLRRVLQDVDVVLMDEGEARELSGEVNLVLAARRVMALGPDAVVVKRGDHGVLLFHGDSIFAAPAFPLEQVADPTGAGDSFAGGFVGYLASTGDLGPAGYRRATVVGSVMGSFAVESFSVDRLSSLTRADIEERFRSFAQLTQFSPLGARESLPWRATDQG